VSASDEASTIAAGVRTVGDARDMLMAAQKSLAEARAELASGTTTWMSTTGQTDSLDSLIDTALGYVTGVYNLLDPYEETDVINAQDKARVGLAAAQAADCMQTVSDTLHQPSFIQGFMADLAGSWSTVVHTVADVAGDIAKPIASAFWPLWVVAGALAAGWVWLNWRALRKAVAL
jgi:hypothetical protein